MAKPEPGGAPRAAGGGRHQGTRLPRKLRVLFPEYDFEDLAWELDRDLVISRVLAKAGTGFIIPRACSSSRRQ